MTLDEYRNFFGMGKKQKLNNMGLQRKFRLPDTQFLQNEYLRASFFPIDPYSSFYALFVANLVSHNSVFLHRPKTQNAHGRRNVMPRCLSEGVDIFLKSAERQGGVNRRFTTGGRCHGWQLEPCPCGLEPLYHFSLENSHLETRHQGVMFRSPWAFVGVTTALRYEPCTQFINVSQRTLRIYFIDTCLRVICFSGSSACIKNAIFR